MVGSGPPPLSPTRFGLSFMLRHLRSGLLLLPLAIGPAQALETPDCQTLMRLDGYLGRAETHCSVAAHPAIEHAVSACRSHMTDAETGPLTLDGMRFAEGEASAKGGYRAWCGFVRSSWAHLLAD